MCVFHFDEQLIGLHCVHKGNTKVICCDDFQCNLIQIEHMPLCRWLLSRRELRVKQATASTAGYNSFLVLSSGLGLRTVVCTFIGTLQYLSFILFIYLPAWRQSLRSQSEDIISDFKIVVVEGQDLHVVQHPYQQTFHRPGGKEESASLGNAYVTDAVGHGCIIQILN